MDHVRWMDGTMDHATDTAGAASKDGWWIVQNGEGKVIDDDDAFTGKPTSATRSHPTVPGGSKGPWASSYGHAASQAPAPFHCSG